MEPDNIRNIAKKLLKLTETDYQVCSYGTTIYELYDELKKDDMLSIVGLLVQRGIIELQPGILFKQAFSQIYLVFDYEPNYQKYDDNIIKECLDFFDDETENGKLYINYPMFESTFYLDDFVSPKSFPYYIGIEECVDSVFKKKVRKITCYKTDTHIDFKFNDTRFIYQSIKWNYLTYLSITNNEIEIDHKTVLDKQILLKNKYNKILLLSIFVLFIVDYNPVILKVIDNMLGLK